MTLAVTFAGEEAFYKRMGTEIYENFPEILPVYKTGKRSGKIDLINTLLYENEEMDWGQIEKRIAVLVTSVAFHTIWKKLYQIEPEFYLGQGTGLLTALVCANSISLRTAILFLRGYRPFKFFVKKTSVPVLSLNNRKELQTAEEILAEMDACVDTDIDYDNFKFIQEIYGIEQFLEVSPGNQMSLYLKNKMPDYVAGFLDKTEDNNYILEHFQYHKNKSFHYCVLRILGILTNTKNNNEDTSTFKDNILVAYLAVKEVVDAANMALLQGEETKISDEDIQKCFEMLKLNFEYKGTDKQEIFDRIYTLEGETLLPIREYFKELYD